MSLFLTREEVQRITKRTRFKAQRDALEGLGYHKGKHWIEAADGEPLVRGDALDAAGKPKQASGHQWNRIGNVRQIRP